MVNFQFIGPTTDPKNLLEADTYYVNDHLPYEDLGDIDERPIPKDPLGHFLNSAGIDASNKFFVFDHYLGMKGYEERSISTGSHYPVKCCCDYLQHLPNYQLDFSGKQKNFNAAMNKPRFSRRYLSHWLANNFDSKEFVYTQSWGQDTNIDYIANIFGSKFDPTHLPKKWLESVVDSSGKNIWKTFYFCLKSELFDISAISIVTEPTLVEPSCYLTEKYINAIYGGTIPLINGYKTYEVLEKIGLDSFGDIIDTRSQYIADPLVRFARLLDDNKSLLKNGLELIGRNDIQDRIRANLSLLRNIPQLATNIFKLNTKVAMQRYHKIIQRDGKVFDWPTEQTWQELGFDSPYINGQ
jgi:hypothetical protein